MRWFLLLPLLGCLIDKDLYEERSRALADADGDGHRAELDCDDGDADVFPGAEERCDGVDQDCDGTTDDDAIDASAWYPDADADGFGAAQGEATTSCDAPAGYAANALDCDDADTSVAPGERETPYDGTDQDCDGADLVDVDEDGWIAEAAGGEDCDDEDEDIHPGAAEVHYDGVDQDCSGQDDADLDGDGEAALAAGGEDCDDTDAQVHPGADETWENGVTDNNCDGELEVVVLEYGTNAWTGEAAGDQAGRRVSHLGDVDGDGLDEYLVGAVYHSDAHEFGGAVYLVPGGQPGGSLTDVPALLPRASMWFLPSGLDGGPDVDGDGIPDLVASATGFEDFKGAAFLVSGAAFAAASLSLPDDALGVVQGDAEGDFAGTDARFLGDVMGDGGQYLAVSSLFADSAGWSEAGVVHIHDASDLTSATPGEAAIRFGGSYDQAQVGNHVAPAGDIDGDGIDDYQVTVEYGDIAYVMPGGLTSPTLPDDALFRLTGTGAGEAGAAEMVGDIDGDGARDLACIADDTTVLLYTALLADPVREIDNPTATVEMGDGALGYDVLDLGDLDADGLDDTLVPVQWQPDVATSQLAVIFGADLGFRATVDAADSRLTALSVRTEARFGYRVDLAGDVDGDGAPNILVGGYSDSAAGTDAGASLTVPLPR